MRHIIPILLENEAGALSRVAGLIFPVSAPSRNILAPGGMEFISIEPYKTGVVDPPEGKHPAINTKTNPKEIKANNLQ